MAVFPDAVGPVTITQIAPKPLWGDEVGEIIDKSIGAVEALQHRALAALRRIFEEQTV